MPRRNLYRYALEMLETTNVFACPVESLRCKAADGEEKSLVEILKRKTTGEAAALRHQTSHEKQKKDAFMAIFYSLEEYAEEYTYTAPFAVREEFRKKFFRWLKKIKEKYQLPVEEAEFTFDSADAGRDTAVAMLKLLQEPGGLTKEELAAKLGISERAVLKNLSRIDHSLGDSRESEEYLRIGGQPVQAKIRVFHNGTGERSRRYRTVNTVHPIILQENLMQAGTLIQALARNYTEHDNDTSYILGLDIWSQLTEYARAKIRDYFAYGDPVVRAYIRELDGSCPDMETAAFQTERDMIENHVSQKREKLLACMKAETRCCEPELDLDGDVRTFASASIRMSDREAEAGGSVYYRAICPGAEEVLFTEDQVLYIELL